MDSQNRRFSTTKSPELQLVPKLHQMAHLVMGLLPLLRSCYECIIMIRSLGVKRQVLKGGVWSVGNRRIFDPQLFGKHFHRFWLQILLVVDVSSHGSIESGGFCLHLMGC